MSDFRASPDGIPEIRKAPAAVLDYSLDWSAWLQPEETISSADWAVPDGITETTSTLSGALATVWLSGGSPGTNYVIGGTIVTSQGRTDTRSFRILCGTR